jgi:hypothetical protein
VTVIVDVPELPALTVTFVAESWNVPVSLPDVPTVITTDSDEPAYVESPE